MIVVGLTGSIGMGKSTTASLFAQEGIPVYDADAVVHELYQNDAVAAVAEAFPGTMKDGGIDRQELSRQISREPEKLPILESIVHPRVRQREVDFLERQRQEKADIVLLDIPLLYETGGDSRVDSVVVVSCDPELQRQRVLARPGMDEEKLKLILARQTPDQEKRRRADFIIDTGHGIDTARRRVKEIIASLRAGRKSERDA